MIGVTNLHAVGEKPQKLALLPEGGAAGHVAAAQGALEYVGGLGGWHRGAGSGGGLCQGTGEVQVAAVEVQGEGVELAVGGYACLLYTSPSPRDS